MLERNEKRKKRTILVRQLKPASDVVQYCNSIKIRISIQFFVLTFSWYSSYKFITRNSLKNACTTVLSKLQPLFQQQTDQVLFVFLHTTHTYEILGYVLFTLLFRFFSRAVVQEQNAK